MHFLLILTLITSLISNPIVKDSWHELYKDALELMEEGKYSEAIGKLKEALDSKDEDKHRIRTYGVKFIEYYPNREIGICYYFLKEYEKAQQYLNRSLQQEESDRAREYLTYAINKNPILAEKEENTNEKEEKSVEPPKETVVLNSSVSSTLADRNQLYSSLSPEQIFYDDFSSNTKGWDLSDNHSISNGQYILNRSGKTITKRLPTAIDPNADFEVSVSAQKLSGGNNNTFNVEWGVRSGEIYAFGITGDGQYRFARYQNNGWTNLVNYTKSTVINNTGMNELKVRKIGYTYDFFINGSYVASSPYITLSGNEIGVSSWADGRFAFDNLSLTQLYPYKRGLPANIFAELSFSDDNGNGIIEANENALISIKLTNQGAGPAYNLRTKLSDSANDPDLYITAANRIDRLNPGESKTVQVNLKSGTKLKTVEHRFEILVTEHFGFDVDPAFLILNAKSFDPPKLLYSGHEIIDFGENAFAITQDGQLEAGEQAVMKIYIQNTGLAAASNINYELTSEDPNIFLTNRVGRLKDLAPGEVADFDVIISPNRRVKTTGNLPVKLSVRENSGLGNINAFQVPLQLNQKPPQKNILTVQSDVSSSSNQIARFEYKSKKFKIANNNLINVKSVDLSKTKRANSVGLIIGVAKYQNLPEAPYADKDAQLMETYFQKVLGVEQVVLAVNDEVSGFFFDDMFNTQNGALAQAVIPGQTDIFVYYSGHGIPNKDGSKTYLFPSDGRVERLDIQGYEIEKFYANLAKLNAKSVTVILDACFSGASRTTEKIDVQNLIAAKGIKLTVKKPWEAYDNFTVINSSTGEETSLGYDDAEFGLFTYYLAAGMKERADADKDRKITLAELKDYVIKNVTDMSKRIRGQQTPEFYGNMNQVLFEY